MCNYISNCFTIVFACVSFRLSARVTPLHHGIAPFFASQPLITSPATSFNLIGRRKKGDMEAVRDVEHVKKRRGRIRPYRKRSLTTEPNLFIHGDGVPHTALMLVFRFVGAPHLESIWACADCNPYWYNWYCHACTKFNRFLHWTPTEHFGHCGQSCGCCRSAVGHFGGCRACRDLRNWKVTSRDARSQLRYFDGR